ncbi:MAG TPA: hypothetical protein VK034_17545, partial [Enhygromyxa sp.]|nr:hypothetical protein [Enhygromyxa sp.]
ESSDADVSDTESSDADVSDTESSGAVPSDARASDAESSNAESGNAESEPDEQKVTEPSPKEQPARPQPKPPDHDAGGEDRPPLPAELHAADDPFSIVQWHRRGYADGLAPACAERVVYLPGSDRACSSAAARKRRRPGSSCSTCMPPEGRPLAPAAPLQLQLPRGLASMIPLALWLRDGRPAADEGAEFGEAAALEYSLDDRGTRLLAVLRTWSLLRRFFPHPHPLTDPQALLLPALCTVAEQPTPLALRQAIEILLAGFQDGNAALLIATEQAAPRHLPELSLGWIEERVVVTRSAIEQVQPGDAITAINGVSIDNLLAEWLIRTPASTATAAIVRTVARLLERDRDGVVVELELDRQDDAGPRELTVQVVADRRADRRPMLADPRPSKPIVELDDGVVYLDATRIRRLAGAARRARRARVVIVDLRGELADPRGSVLAHFIDTGRALAIERMPTGPDPAGQLPLEPVGERRVEPDGPRLHARPLILADARTRGRAELELAGFDQLGATVIGSTSAGDLGAVATAWLPGGWQLRFTHGELRRLDGSRLWGLGVTPTLPIEPTRASLRAQVDPLLAAALELARKP